MKQLTSDEFKNFLEAREVTQKVEITRKNFTKEVDAPIMFVIIKTAHCVKCESLVKKADSVFKDMLPHIVSYVFKPGDEIADSLAQLDLTSVPVIVTRFTTKKGEFKLGKIVPDFEEDFINLANTFDAIIANDQSFFGYNEFDEILDQSDYDPMMNRLLRNIHGELDPEVEKERLSLKKEVGQPTK
jgi:hypothetical protein